MTPNWGGRRAQAWKRAVLARYGTVCHLRLPGVCTLVATTGDHLVPRSVDLSLQYEVSNGRPACAPCNFKRKAALLVVVVNVDESSFFEAARLRGMAYPLSPPGPQENRPTEHDGAGTMTEPTDFDQVEAALPGLGAQPARGTAGVNEIAARRTLAALRAADLIGEQHAAMMEAMLTAARQLDRAATSVKAKDYGVANLLAQYRETYLVLVPDEQGGDSDPFERFQRELAEEQRRSADLRDPTQP